MFQRCALPSKALTCALLINNNNDIDNNNLQELIILILSYYYYYYYYYFIIIIIILIIILIKVTQLGPIRPFRLPDTRAEKTTPVGQELEISKKQQAANNQTYKQPTDSQTTRCLPKVDKKQTVRTIQHTSNDVNIGINITQRAHCLPLSLRPLALRQRLRRWRQKRR